MFLRVRRLEWVVDDFCLAWRSINHFKKEKRPPVGGSGKRFWGLPLGQFTKPEDGRRRLPVREFLFRRLARVMCDVCAGNAQVRQFTVGQVGQLVIGLTVALPGVVFANY